MGVLAERSCVCVIACVCVCEGGSGRDRGKLTENRKYMLARMKRLIFSRSWLCPYSLSAFGNHTAKKSWRASWRAVCICNLCHREIQSAHPVLPQNHLLIFPSHPPPFFPSKLAEDVGALHQITPSMSFPRQNGLVRPMQLMALALHIRPQDVRINLTASIVGQDGSPLLFDVS